jgi:hypothetical protein
MRQARVGALCRVCAEYDERPVAQMYVRVGGLGEVRATPERRR